MCKASAFYQQLVQVAALAVARQAPSVQVDVPVGLDSASEHARLKFLVADHSRNGTMAGRAL